MSLSFRPAIVASLRGYDGARFARDLSAGLVVGVVAIPLALAFAIASGVPPHAGLATAVVAGFVASALGGSKVQISGPTGAFVVIVAGIVARHGVDGLALATLMAGVILVVFGACRLGQVIKFIPDPVVAGFTAGIGAIIFIGQLKEVLGLGTLELPESALGKLLAIVSHAGEANPWAVAVALGTVAVIVATRRLAPRVPGPVLALVGFTTLAAALSLPVETLGDRFGALPRGLSFHALPPLSLARLEELLPAALTIALLGSIESLLSAVVADARTEERHDSDQELVAQGLANVASPFFGGIPATGAIARTATNIQNGGTTPVAGLVHAAVVFLAVTLAAPALQAIPLAVLGGVLVVVAWYMSDVPRLMAIGHLPKSDAAVLVTTFALTVLVDLVVAVEVGMVLAAFLFMYRMSNLARVEVVHPELDASYGRQQSIHDKEVPEGVATYSIDGPFFFGAAERFQRSLERLSGYPPVLIFRMRHVPYMDATGLAVMEDMVRAFRKRGSTVVLSAVQEQPLALMRKGRFLEVVGPENVQPDIDSALARARAILGAKSS